MPGPLVPKRQLRAGPYSRADRREHFKKLRNPYRRVQSARENPADVQWRTYY